MGVSLGINPYYRSFFWVLSFASPSNGESMYDIVDAISWTTDYVPKVRQYHHGFDCINSFMVMLHARA
jgi:hypothetical protein